MTATYIGILLIGSFIVALAASLVMAIRATLRDVKDASVREAKVKQLIIGREYLVKDADGKWFTGVYGGMNLDGWRRFVNLDSFHGVSIKVKRPESLFNNGDVKWIFTQSPLPEREYDKRNKAA